MLSNLPFQARTNKGDKIRMYPERMTASILCSSNIVMMALSWASRRSVRSKIVLSNSIVAVLTLCASALPKPATPAMFETTSMVSCEQGLDCWCRSSACIPEPEPEMKTARRRGSSVVATRTASTPLTGWAKSYQLKRLGTHTRRVIGVVLRGETWESGLRRSTPLSSSIVLQVVRPRVACIQRWDCYSWYLRFSVFGFPGGPPFHGRFLRRFYSLIPVKRCSDGR